MNYSYLIANKNNIFEKSRALTTLFVQTDYEGIPMKILALAASSSSTSINKQLATYAAGLVTGAEVEVLDINDYEMPIFSEDKEKELGQPEHFIHSSSF